MHRDEIDNLFTHHPPQPENEQVARYEQIREGGKTLAHLINDLCPDSGEKRLAIRDLESAVMRANQSIAINE